MKLLMPSHVKRVAACRDPTPVFQRYGVEDQLSAMYHPVVQLKSGGYLVINPTEALVSIDINSGRSTREHNIEQTAFATNIEAAHEIARQLRLRDMAGLVVIDFIDMEQSSHNRKVEKAMKDALKNDRARIQVGRISSFGLMEISRQRLRTGVLEASTKACPHCEGTGLMRTASSSGLSALRIIEDEAARGRGDRILLRAGREAAIYVLNKKRTELAEIDERYGVTVEVIDRRGIRRRSHERRELGARPNPKDRPIAAPIIDEDEDLDEVESYDDIEDEAEETSEERPARREASRDGPREARGESDEEGARRKRRRRRGGRGRNRRDGERDSVERDVGETGEQDVSPVDADEQQPQVDAERQAEQGDDGDERQRSRRGRRGGRSRRGRSDAAPLPEGEVEADSSPMAETSVADEVRIADIAAPADIEPVAEEKPKARRRPRARKADADAPVEPAPADVTEEAPVAPKRRSRAKKVVLPVDTDVAIELAVADASARMPIAASNDRIETADRDDANSGEGSEARRGWWQRTFG